MSGLRINYSKKQIIRFRSKKYSNDKLCTEWNLQWGKCAFDLLGIHFDVDLHKITSLNYDKKMVKIKQTLQSWSKRYLTQISKITVIKTLLFSQLNHLLHYPILIHSLQT